MEVKYSKDKNTVRNLLERAIALDIGAKKMKFFYKKYFKFEVENGSQNRIEYV